MGMVPPPVRPKLGRFRALDSLGFRVLLVVLSLVVLAVVWCEYRGLRVIGLESACAAGEYWDLGGWQQVGQDFLLAAGGVCGVDVWLDPGGGNAGELVSLVLFEVRGSRRRELRRAEVRLPRWGGTGWYSFTFPPVEGVEGRYRFVLTAPECGGTPVGVQVCAGDAYADGGAWTGAVCSAADVRFRVYRRERLSELLAELGGGGDAAGWPRGWYLVAGYLLLAVLLAAQMATRIWAALLRGEV